MPTTAHQMSERVLRATTTTNPTATSVMHASSAPPA